MNIQRILIAAFVALSIAIAGQPRAQVTVTRAGLPASTAFAINKGATLPATCVIGDVFFKTDATAGQNIYECASADTWTQQLNSGAGSGSITASGYTQNTAKVLGRATAGSGAIEELSMSGTGNVAMTTSPVFTTPNIGSATGSISGNAATVTTIKVVHCVAASDETTALTTGTAKVTFRMPYAMTVTDVRGSVTTAATGATLLTVDVNEGGTTILSTKLTFDASEKTTTTAATPPVISDSALADDAEMTVDIDAVGNTIAGAGLKVCLIGTRS